jgi:TetR/AcrR family transcriptional regulator of autoinduction and epiphytic fitness
MSGIREKQLEKRKQETLDVALRLLLERGYANLNMDELAEEAGISKPTLYQYFDSKEDLVAKAMGRMFEKMEELVPEPSDTSPLEQLENFLRVMLKTRTEKRYLMAPGDMEVLRAMHQNNPTIFGHMQSAKNKLEKLVRQGQTVGEIDPALPAWVVVNTLFSLQRVISNPFAKDEPQRSEAELAAAIESIIRFFKQGIGMAMPMNT